MELVDTTDSKSVAFAGLGVRVPPSVPTENTPLHKKENDQYPLGSANHLLSLTLGKYIYLIDHKILGPPDLIESLSSIVEVFANLTGLSLLPTHLNNRFHLTFSVLADNKMKKADAIEVSFPIVQCRTCLSWPLRHSSHLAQASVTIANQYVCKIYTLSAFKLINKRIAYRFTWPRKI